jgi:uncharacterized protein (DUF58 family)
MVRLLGVLAVFLAVALAGAAAALATSDTQSQNPALTVSVSLSPDVVAVGDTVAATESVTNTSSSKQVVQVVSTLTYPNGTTASTSTKVALKPGETFSQSASYTRDADDAAGTYTLTVSATSRTGTSTAQASVVYS